MPERARSILLANDFPPIASGIASCLFGIWERLPEDNTRIVAPRVQGDLEIDRNIPCPVTRIWLPLGETHWAKILKTLITTIYMLKLAVSQRPAIFHCGQVLSSGLGGWLCRAFFNIPYVVFVYGSETVRLGSGPQGLLLRRILTTADRVFTCSDSTGQELSEFGIPREKILTIYPSVDLDVFRPGTAASDTFGVGDRRVILTVARLDQRKGHDVVLRALPHLLPDYAITYLIGGRGREEERLRRLTDELGLHDHVRFLGFVPEEKLPELYNACDVFVMPNRVTSGTDLSGDIEGFGITFIEAGACEKPVIGGRSGGATEAIVDGKTGLLVNPDLPEEVADAIARLLDDRALAQRLGQNARRRIERSFSWDVTTAQMRDYI